MKKVNTSPVKHILIQDFVKSTSQVSITWSKLIRTGRNAPALLPQAVLCRIFVIIFCTAKFLNLFVYRSIKIERAISCSFFQAAGVAAVSAVFILKIFSLKNFSIKRDAGR